MDLTHINHRLVRKEALEEARQDVEWFQAGPSVAWSDSSDPEFEFVCEIARKFSVDDLTYFIAYVRELDGVRAELNYIELRADSKKRHSEGIPF